MAVIVKNTFLDIASEQEQFGADKRSQSLPRTWKPTTGIRSSLPALSIKSISTHRPSFSGDSSTQASARSDYSFLSASDSLEHSSATSHSGVSPVSELASRSSLPINMVDLDADEMAGPSSSFCMTPTGSVGSPRECLERSLNHGAFCLCYLSSVGPYQCRCALANSDDVLSIPDFITTKYVKGVRVQSGASYSEPVQQQQLASEPEACVECNTDAPSGHTKLTSLAPAFQSVPTDSRVDAVAHAVYLALASCGQICEVKVDKDTSGKAATSIVAELQGGQNAAARCYDTMSLARQSLEAVTAHLPTVTLLSARVQKEERGYSLRASIACPSEVDQERMCWDLFKKGYCPRRSCCRWYHPQDADIARLKISIKYTEEVTGSPALVAEEGSSSKRHKLNLGDLV